MAERSGDGTADLPEALVELLDGTHLASKEGVTFLLAAIGESGWPHIAMLSVGELVAISPQDILMALWPTSRTVAGLTRNGKATISLVYEGVAYRLLLEARRLDDLQVMGRRLAFFSARIVECSEDAVNYAHLTAGITFELADPEAVLPRWEATVAAMLQRAGRPLA